MKKFSTITTLSAILLIFSTNLFAQSTELAVKKFDPYAVIKAYYGYHNTNPEVGDGETDLAYRLQGNSRAGAKFDIENVNIQVELGLLSSISLRLAVAAVTFSELKVTVGQTYTPYAWFANGDYVDDNNIIGFGAAYDGRIPQLRFDLYGAYVALIGENRSTAGIIDGAGTGGLAIDTTAIAPKTAIGYELKLGDTVLGIGGAANVIKINDPVSAVDGKNLISGLGYLHGKAVLGDFILTGNLAYGQNTGNFGIINVSNPDTLGSKTGFALPTTVVQVGNKLNTTKTIEGFINPQYKISSDLIVGAGVGFAQAKNDTFNKADAQIAYFADLKYNINKYFSILPTFSYRDYLNDKNGDKQGTEYYAGTQLQISI